MPSVSVSERARSGAGPEAAVDTEARPHPGRLAVSIVNYRTAELTLTCLESVLEDLAASGLSGAEVVVVDNASGDGSADRIADWIASRPGTPARLVRSGRNAGFSAGHNQAIAAAEGAHVLLLNSDAVVRPGCLSALLSAMAAAPDLGVLSARLEDDAGQPQTSCFRFPNAASELVRGACTGPVTALFKRWDVPLGPDPVASEIEWTSFACVLLHREAIRAAGPLDEGFFLYFEDVEYCLRARRAGWRIGHCPSARAVHLEGGSGPAAAARAARQTPPDYVYASRARYFRLKGGRVALAAANLGWTLGRAVALLRPLLGKPVPPAPKEEWRRIWTGMAGPLRPGQNG